MATTLSRVVLDRAGDLAMLVHPDDDNQLSDPAFAPANTHQLDLTKAEFRNTLTQRDLFALLQAKLAVSKPTIAAILGARVALFDAVQQAQSDLDAWANLAASFGANPTAGQILQINAARATAPNSVQAAQTARTNLQTLIAALP